MERPAAKQDLSVDEIEPAGFQQGDPAWPWITQDRSDQDVPSIVGTIGDRAIVV
jgi:hypothetical protein